MKNQNTVTSSIVASRVREEPAWLTSASGRKANRGTKLHRNPYCTVGTVLCMPRTAGWTWIFGKPRHWRASTFRQLLGSSGEIYAQPKRYGSAAWNTGTRNSHCLGGRACASGRQKCNCHRLQGRPPADLFDGRY